MPSGISQRHRALRSSQAVMANQSARRRGATESVPEQVWPVRSGRPPVITDFLSPRPETGYGLDLGLPEASTTILAGPSGCGKTYLAVAAAAAASRDGGTDLQVWVNASSPSAVVTGYARAAGDIGLTDRGVPPEAAAARFLDWLSRTDRSWLVVLDNVIDLAGLSGLWPAGSAGQVLVTCHQGADLSWLAESRPLACQGREVSPPEALSFLTGPLDDPPDKA